MRTVPVGSRVSVVGQLLGWSALSRVRTLLVVAASLAGTGLLDYATGERYAVSPLYLFPVLIASASLGRWSGMAVALTAAVVWTFAQQPPGPAGGSPHLIAWNVVMRFGVLGFIAWLLSEIQQELIAARYDSLTRLHNRRYFMRSLEAERSRSDRTGGEFSVLLLDLDRFKLLNDTQGHAAGDEALRVVAELLSRGARTMDLSARVGGDEFCVLLPGASAEIARAVARRLHSMAAAEFARRGWPIGVSIGVATTRGAVETTDQILRRADALMYEEKLARRRGAAAADPD